MHNTDTDQHEACGGNDPMEYVNDELADWEEASPEVRDSCARLSKAIEEDVADFASVYLTVDMEMQKAPEGFDFGNEFHRSLVTWGVRAGFKSTVTAVVHLGMHVAEDEKSRA